MCICIHCYYVDQCTTYHAVEYQHHQPHLTENPDYEAQEPTNNVHIRTRNGGMEMEWDVVGCGSFREELGKWIQLRPGELVPT